MKKTVLFLDIVGSSQLWSASHDQMKRTLDKFHKHITKQMPKYTNAFIIKTIGDAYMISFDNYHDAFDFAAKLQQHLKDKSAKYLVGTHELKTRIGIAHGKVEIKKINIQNHELIDYFGNTVNTASRMESKVSPVGGIGIVMLDETPINFNKFIDKFEQKLDNLSVKYELLSFADNCQNLYKRSSRLLTNYHYNCKSIDELKGVKSVDGVFKIYL
jgi:hypothetical protein